MRLHRTTLAFDAFTRERQQCISSKNQEHREHQLYEVILSLRHKNVDFKDGEVCFVDGDHGYVHDERL